MVKLIFRGGKNMSENVNQNSLALLQFCRGN